MGSILKESVSSGKVRNFKTLFMNEEVKFLNFIGHVAFSVWQLVEIFVFCLLKKEKEREKGILSKERDCSI